MGDGGDELATLKLHVPLALESVLQVARHAIEGFAEIGHFVGALDLDASVECAAGQSLGAHMKGRQAPRGYGGNEASKGDGENEEVDEGDNEDRSVGGLSEHQERGDQYVDDRHRAAEERGDADLDAEARSPSRRCEDSERTQRQGCDARKPQVDRRGNHVRVSRVKPLHEQEDGHYTGSDKTAGDGCGYAHGAAHGPSSL